MKLSFNYGKAVRYNGKDDGVKNHYGYNWWLWVPFIRLRVKKYGTYFDFSWLCYWWGVTFLPFYKETGEKGQELKANQ